MNKQDFNEINTKNFKREKGIYAIENTITGRTYVGQAQSIYTRLIHHKHRLLNKNHANPYLQNSVNKHGIENFKFYVVEYLKNFNLDQLTEKEKYHIKNFNLVYNIKETVNSVNQNNRKPSTKETRLKISLANKGKIPKNLFNIQKERRRKISFYINDKLIKIFDSCKDAAEYFNVLPKFFHMYINKITNRKSKYFPLGYKFKYYE